MTLYIFIKNKHLKKLIKYQLNIKNLFEITIILYKKFRINKLIKY